MSTLVIDKDVRALKRRGFRYFVISLAVFALGMIYERFSHGVYSGFMMFAFAIPLAGGALPCFALERFGKKRMPGKLIFQLSDFGLSACTVGSILKGVLEIYGTTNRLLAVYWYAGAGFLAAAVLLYLLALSGRKRVREEK